MQLVRTGSRRWLTTLIVAGTFLIRLAAQNTVSLSPADIAQLKSHAESGDASAQQKLGTAYHFGNGVPTDDTQAFTWCLKAAEQGSASAEDNVAYLYQIGAGVTKDMKLSFDWRLKAATQGSPQAEVALGENYLRGEGVPKDFDQAIGWYRKAAVQGNSEGAMRLGAALLGAKRSPPEIREGFTYMLRNTRSDAYAAYWIGYCYRAGLFVTKDPVNAYAWFLRASSLPPSPNAKDLPAAMAETKAALTPDQIRQAEDDCHHLADFIAARIQSPDLTATFAKGSSALMPFEYIRRSILLPVQTQDGKSAYLLFDTGADTSILDQAFATRIGLKGNVYLPITGIGQNLGLSTISDETAFSLPGLTFNKARWTIMPDLGMDAEMGKPVVGVLGLDLAGRFVIRLDFIRHTIEFIQPDAFKPPSESIHLPLHVNDNRATIDVTLGSGTAKAQAPLLVDSGDDSTLDLTKIFLNRNPALHFEALASNGASGFGGSIYSSSSICPELTLGELTLPNVPVNLDQTIQGVEAEINGKAGNELWERFDVAFDFPGQRLYLQENVHFHDPYQVVTAGMHVMASGDNYEILTIHEIVPGSAGEQAGFHSGDVLLGVDELGKTPLTASNVFLPLHSPGTHHFHIRRGDQLLDLTLELKTPPSSAAP